MSWTLITPPTGLAVSLEEAQDFARADRDDAGVSALDGEIKRAIRTYTTEAESETRRAVMQQTWLLTLDAFPQAIRLHKPPLLEVDHVKYRDVDGELQILDPQDYLVDDRSEPGFIIPAPGRAWPATARQANAVEVQFQCGYGADHERVPDAIAGFILNRIGEHFQSGGQPKNERVKALLWHLVVHG